MDLRQVLRQDSAYNTPALKHDPPYRRLGFLTQVDGNSSDWANCFVDFKAPATETIEQSSMMMMMMQIQPMAIRTSAATMGF